jgi:hypothetical protein
MDKLLKGTLGREPKPELAPAFSTRVLAEAQARAARRAKLWLRLYWFLALAGIAAILWRLDWPEWIGRMLFLLGVPASFLLALADPNRVRRLMRILALMMMAAVLSAEIPAPPKGWRALFDGKTLNGWEKRGDGQWTVTSDGALVGQRVFSPYMLAPGKMPFKEEKEYRAWLNTQAWLYTVAEFADFDLHVEFWTRTGGNSGISLRDTTRGEHAISTPADFNRTPAKIGYEIQINNRYPDPTPTGSVYTFTKAPKEALREDDWNTFEIEVRKETIRVKLNGQRVSDMKCDPKRAVRGPIGLQLHDQFSVIQFRNIWIRER